MAQKFGVDIRAVRLLLETGVLASYEGMHEEGEAMVRGVQSFRDDVPQPWICLVSAFYFQRRNDDAIAEAKALLKRFPNCQMAKALMGTCMFSAGYRDWQIPLKEVMEDGRDEWAIDMARTVLGFEHLGPAAKIAVQRPYVGAIFA
jgi:Bacterial type III secretion protein (HrpB1_HrpK)